MKLLKSLILKSKEKIELYKIQAQSNSPKNILITGVFHGEEPQGYFAIKDFFFDKENNFYSKNNIYIIPCLNPDGMKKNIRNNSNGVDLNRNFPTKNWQKTVKNSEYYGGEFPSSEKETIFMTDIIKEINPDFILTLHSPYAVVNYDGDAINEAQKISEFTLYPVQKDIGYPTPGSFGTYCGIERNIPTVTLEFNDKEDIDKIIDKSSKIFEWLMRDY